MFEAEVFAKLLSAYHAISQMINGVLNCVLIKYNTEISQSNQAFVRLQLIHDT